MGRYRERHDPGSRVGIPAHITVLFPFLSPVCIDVETLGSLQELFARRRPFGFGLTKLAQFPGVLYLAPASEEEFVTLTRVVDARWPEAPPYEGAFDTVVPHLTVGFDMDEHERARAIIDLACQLPIEASAYEVQLFIERQGHWRVVERFRLGS